MLVSKMIDVIFKCAMLAWHPRYQAEALDDKEWNRWSRLACVHDLIHFAIIGMLIIFYTFALSFTVAQILGSFSKPGRSCKHIKDETSHSLRDGEYWIEPTGTGKPFIVYCDMTTDGGKSLS